MAGPYHLINPDNIFIDPQAKLSPGVVIDADKGPVIIDAHAGVVRTACCMGRVISENTRKSARWR